MEEHCGNCKFFKRAEIMKAGGWCREDSPKFVLVGLNQATQMPVVSTFFPQTVDTEWCGKWRIRPPITAEIDLSKIDADALQGNA